MCVIIIISCLKVLESVHSNFVKRSINAQSRFVKKVFLKFRKIYRKTSVSESFLATLLKKQLRYRCFPVYFAKFLLTLFLQNTSAGFFI